MGSGVLSVSATQAIAPIKLHLGAFDRGIRGWVNTDVTPHILISRIPFAATALHGLGRMHPDKYRWHREGRFRMLEYLDLCKPLRYPDNSAAAVFSSHVFEHLFPDEVERLVAEIRRVLMPGGVCRVVVPDLEKVVAGFDPEAPESFLNSVFEAATRSAVKNGHHWGFTGPSIRKLFRSHGFAEAEIVAYRVGRCPDIDVLDNRPDESLFFEAVK